MGVWAKIYTQLGVIIQPYYNMCPACTHNVCPIFYGYLPGYITPPGITIQPNYESHNLCPVCSAGLCGAQQSGYNTPMGYILQVIHK